MSQNASYILQQTSSFPSDFATNISCPLHNNFKPPLATQSSGHILSNDFDKSFNIAVVFKNQAVDFFCLSCQVLIIYTCTELQSLTRHIYQNDSTFFM